MRGVTFDFWNTLYTDGGDDTAGTITARRIEVLRQALRQRGAGVPDEALWSAHRSGLDAGNEAWYAWRQYGARDYVRHVFNALAFDPSDDLVHATARAIEEVGQHAQLRLLPGAAETITTLARQDVILGLISDTVLTPGRVLNCFLERDGLLPFFAALTYSDVTGFPKPDPRMFYQTLQRMSVVAEEALHVGDVPRTDIAGALHAGMRAVRYAGEHDLRDPPKPLAVIHDHRELLRIIRV
ncbi:MAG: HAD family hydrolase [Thermoleophilia bacterium]|nr:HAD family hydrolase [Thermoleophilia bacterium]